VIEEMAASSSRARVAESLAASADFPSVDFVSTEFFSAVFGGIKFLSTEFSVQVSEEW
jgi:hypothetical protein